MGDERHVRLLHGRLLIPNGAATGQPPNAWVADCRGAISERRGFTFCAEPRFHIWAAAILTLGRRTRQGRRLL
jgi:hypothetical protein